MIIYMQNNEFEKEVGLVRANKHYLLSIEGLPSAKVNNIIVNNDGKRALVTGLSHDAVEAMMLDRADVHPGEQFEIHSQENQLSIGEHLFGRVINALGDPIDDKGGFPPKNRPLVLEKDGGTLVDRETIFDQFETGFSIIDTVLPIGKGQRQLLMGPVRSGIDVFCKRIIHNQINNNVICIYVTIGKPPAYIRNLAESVLKGDSGKYSIIIASSSEDFAPVSIITPAIALDIAEYFCDGNEDVLLIFDDLYTHAKYLREIALLQGNLPGRESYPGDIFYKQAHLIERAGNFNGKGSITLLPILQTDIESATDLIMTNIMGTTDGHMVFDSKLYARGVFPPVLEEESVTRVGKHTQTIVQKQLSSAIVSLLADAKEQERYTQFGTKLSESARDIISMGESVRSFLNQSETDVIDIETQLILLSLVFTSMSTDNDASFFSKNYKNLVNTISKKKEFEKLKEYVHKGKSFDDFLDMMEKNISLFNKVCHK